jgi:hypothetical protein
MTKNDDFTSQLIRSLNKDYKTKVALVYRLERGFLRMQFYMELVAQGEACKISDVVKTTTCQ